MRFGRIDLTRVKSIQLNSPDGELNYLRQLKCTIVMNNVGNAFMHSAERINPFPTICGTLNETSTDSIMISSKINKRYKSLRDFLYVLSHPICIEARYVPAGRAINMQQKKEKNHEFRKIIGIFI